MVAIFREDGSFWYNEAHGSVSAVMQDFTELGYTIESVFVHNGNTALRVKEA